MAAYQQQKTRGADRAMSRTLDFSCPECNATELRLFDIDWYGGNTEGMAVAICLECNKHYKLEVFMEEPQ